MGISKQSDCFVNINKIVEFVMTKSAALQKWFDSPLGQHLLAYETAYFKHALTDVFGYHAVQCGLPAFNFLASSHVHTNFCLHETIEYDNNIAKSMHAERKSSFLLHLIADFEQLPLATHSIDVVVLPHILELSRDPHQILREMERVLVPEGRIILSGFNPLSLWGIGQFCRCSTLPRSLHFHSLSRVKDWLAVLGFSIERGCFRSYIPPVTSPVWQQRFRFLELAGDRWWAMFGNVYFLQAIKRVPGIHRPHLHHSWRQAIAAKPFFAKTDTCQTHCERHHHQCSHSLFDMGKPENSMIR